jgi:enoyl-CoA hydratase/carnithine racemase
MSRADATGPSLSRIGSVYLLHLGDGENRFNPQWCAAVMEYVREVEAAPAPRALVTYASGKYFSTGFDLEWFENNPELGKQFIGQFQSFLGDFAVAGVPTVAAITGHGYAAGFLLALCHDFRVMSRDRGYLCLPEVDLKMAFTPGIIALAQAKLAPELIAEAMLTARRYTADDAVVRGLVDVAESGDNAVAKALEIAAGMASKPPKSYSAIKHRLYGHARDILCNQGE